MDVCVQHGGLFELQQGDIVVMLSNCVVLRVHVDGAYRDLLHVPAGFSPQVCAETDTQMLVAEDVGHAVGGGYDPPVA